MKKLTFLQLISLSLYIGGGLSEVGLFLMANKLFRIPVPGWVLALSVLLILPMSACLRIIAYRKRHGFLTTEELKRTGPKIYFFTAVGELLVFVIGLGFVLSSL